MAVSGRCMVKNGDECPAPVGTQIYRGEALVADLTTKGQQAVVARGRWWLWQRPF